MPGSSWPRHVHPGTPALARRGPLRGPQVPYAPVKLSALSVLSRGRSADWLEIHIPRSACQSLPTQVPGRFENRAVMGCVTCSGERPIVESLGPRHIDQDLIKAQKIRVLLDPGPRDPEPSGKNPRKPRCAHSQDQQHQPRQGPAGTGTGCLIALLEKNVWLKRCAGAPVHPIDPIA